MRTKRTKGATGYCWAVYTGGVITPVSIVNNHMVGSLTDNVTINPGKTREVMSDLPIGTLVTVMVLAQSTLAKARSAHRLPYM